VLLGYTSQLSKYKEQLYLNTVQGAIALAAISPNNPLCSVWNGSARKKPGLSHGSKGIAERIAGSRSHGNVLFTRMATMFSYEMSCHFLNPA
jgi:hypothetical protein